jgi:hypothetical protein
MMQTLDSYKCPSKLGMVSAQMPLQSFLVPTEKPCMDEVRRVPTKGMFKYCACKGHNYILI